MLKEIKYTSKTNKWKEKYKDYTYNCSEHRRIGKCVCECGNDTFIVTDHIIAMSEHSSAPPDYEAELRCSKCGRTDKLDHAH